MQKEISLDKYKELPFYIVNLIEAVLLMEEVNIASVNPSRSVIVFKAGKVSKKYKLPINVKYTEASMHVKRECRGIARFIREKLGFYDKVT